MLHITYRYFAQETAADVIFPAADALSDNPGTQPPAQKQSEKSLCAREDALTQWELDLRQREDALAQREAALHKTPQPDPALMEQARAAVQLQQTGCHQLDAIQQSMLDLRSQCNTLIQSVRQDFLELNQKYQGHTPQEGLRQLCLLLQDMEQSQDAGCLCFAQRLRMQLLESFGCEPFSPAPGDPFDPLQMQQEWIGALPDSPVVQAVSACGWRYGEQILCKATVSLEKEVLV